MANRVWSGGRVSAWYPAGRRGKTMARSDAIAIGETPHSSGAGWADAVAAIAAPATATATATAVRVVRTSLRMFIVISSLLSAVALRDRWAKETPGQ
jgi:hypothetical protein